MPDALPAVTEPLLAEDRLEGAELFKRRLARMLVLFDHRHGALAAGDLDGNDLLGQTPRRDGARRAGLAAQRERILIGAGDLVFGGKIFRRLAHGVDAVHRLQLRIDEAPAQGRIEDFGIAREGFARLAHDERGAGHALDASRDGDIHFAGANGASRRAQRVETRTAQAIDRRAGHFLRDARKQQRHARDIAVVLAGLVGAAREDVLDRARGQAGNAGEQAGERVGEQVVGPHAGQRAGVTANGRAHAGAQEGF